MEELRHALALVNHGRKGLWRRRLSDHFIIFYDRYFFRIGEWWPWRIWDTRFFSLLFHSFWIMNNIEIGNFYRPEHDAGRCSHNHLIWHKVFNNSPFSFCCFLRVCCFQWTRGERKKEEEEARRCEFSSQSGYLMRFNNNQPQKEKARKMVNKSICYVDFESSRSLWFSLYGTFHHVCSQNGPRDWPSPSNRP